MERTDKRGGETPQETGEKKKTEAAAEDQYNSGGNHAYLSK